MNRHPKSRLPSVVVAIPAHDEVATIGGCLRSVVAAVHDALDRGQAERIVIELVCHRCADESADIARRELGSYLDGEVIEIVDAADVGAVRDLAVRQGIARLGRTPAEIWVCSTDADTTVPVDWIARTLAEAREADVVCVAGLAALDEWRGSSEAQRAYDQIVTDKLYVDGSGKPTHGHVYGANLAARADAYLAVGGFVSSAHGEDQRLVDALVASGYPVLRSTTLKVVTSGRTHGRAANGLADLLRRLDSGIAGTADEGHDEGLVGLR